MHNNRLQRAVIDKAPTNVGQRAAAELQRYAATQMPRVIVAKQLARLSDPVFSSLVG